MNTNLLFGHAITYRKLRFVILAFFWTIGFAIGISLAVLYPKTSLFDIRQVLTTYASPLSLFFVVGLPISISVFSLWCPAFFLNYPLLFLNAMCRGFTGMLLYIALESGAWLIRFLYLFSGSCISVLIWWLLLRHPNQNCPAFSRDVRFVSILSCLIVVADIFFISPFLANISKYI